MRKSEIRSPKSEGSPKSEIRRDGCRTLAGKQVHEFQTEGLLAVSMQSGGVLLTPRRKAAKPQRALMGTGSGHRSATGNQMLQSLSSPCAFAPLRLCVENLLPDYGLAVSVPSELSSKPQRRGERRGKRLFACSQTSHHSVSQQALAGELFSLRSSRLCGSTQSSRPSSYGFGFRTSTFGFPSDFGFRISDLSRSPSALSRRRPE